MTEQHSLDYYLKKLEDVINRPDSYKKYSDLFEVYRFICERFSKNIKLNNIELLKEYKIIKDAINISLNKYKYYLSIHNYNSLNKNLLRRYYKLYITLIYITELGFKDDIFKKFKSYYNSKKITDLANEISDDELTIITFKSQSKALENNEYINRVSDLIVLANPNNVKFDKKDFIFKVKEKAKEKVLQNEEEKSKGKSKIICDYEVVNGELLIKATQNTDYNSDNEGNNGVDSVNEVNNDVDSDNEGNNGVDSVNEVNNDVDSDMDPDDYIFSINDNEVSEPESKDNVIKEFEKDVNEDISEDELKEIEKEKELIIKFYDDSEDDDDTIKKNEKLKRDFDSLSLERKDYENIVKEILKKDPTLSFNDDYITNEKFINRMTPHVEESVRRQCVNIDHSSQKFNYETKDNPLNKSDNDYFELAKKLHPNDPSYTKERVKRDSDLYDLEQDIKKGRFQPDALRDKIFKEALKDENYMGRLYRNTNSKVDKIYLTLHKTILIGLDSIEKILLTIRFLKYVEKTNNFVKAITYNLVKNIENGVASLSEISGLTIEQEFMNKLELGVRQFVKEKNLLIRDKDDIEINDAIIDDIINIYTEYQIERQYDIIISVSDSVTKSIQELNVLIEDYLNGKKDLDIPELKEFDNATIENLFSDISFKINGKSRMNFLKYRAKIARLIRTNGSIRKEVVSNMRTELRLVLRKIGFEQFSDFIKNPEKGFFVEKGKPKLTFGKGDITSNIPKAKEDASEKMEKIKNNMELINQATDNIFSTYTKLFKKDLDEKINNDNNNNNQIMIPPSYENQLTQYKAFKDYYDKFSKSIPPSNPNDPNNPNNFFTIKPVILPTSGSYIILTDNLLMYNEHFPVGNINEIVHNVSGGYINHYNDVDLRNFILSDDAISRLPLMLNFFDINKYLKTGGLNNGYFSMNQNYKNGYGCVVSFLIDARIRYSAAYKCSEHLNQFISIGRYDFVPNKGLVDNIIARLRIFINKLINKLNPNVEFDLGFNNFEYGHQEGRLYTIDHLIPFEKFDKEQVTILNQNFKNIYKDIPNNLFSYINYIQKVIPLSFNNDLLLNEEELTYGDMRRVNYLACDSKLESSYFRKNKFNNVKILKLLAKNFDLICNDVLHLNSIEKDGIGYILSLNNVNDINKYLMIMNYIYTNCSFDKGYTGEYDVNKFVHIIPFYEVPKKYTAEINDSFIRYGQFVKKDYKEDLKPDDINESIENASYDTYKEISLFNEIKGKSIKRRYNNSYINLVYDKYGPPYFYIPRLDLQSINNQSLKYLAYNDSYFKVALSSHTNIFIPDEKNNIFIYYGFEKYSKKTYKNNEQYSPNDGFKINTNLRKAFKETKIFEILRKEFYKGSIPVNNIFRAFKLCHWVCSFLDNNNYFRRISYELHVFNKAFRTIDTINTAAKGTDPYLFIAPFIPLVGINGNNKEVIRNVNFFQIEYEIVRIKNELGRVLPLYVKIYYSENMNYGNDNGLNRLIEVPLMKLGDFFLSKYVSAFREGNIVDKSDFFEEYKITKDNSLLQHNFDFRFIYRIEIDIDKTSLQKINLTQGKMLPVKINSDNKIINDFSYKIQIYSPFTEDELKYNCFVWSILNGDDKIFTDEELYKIKEKFSIGFITNEKLHEFAEEFNCDLIIYKSTYKLGIIPKKCRIIHIKSKNIKRKMKLGLIVYGLYSHFIPIFKTKVKKCDLKKDIKEILNYKEVNDGKALANSYELLTKIIDSNGIDWLNTIEDEDFNYNRGKVPVDFESIKKYPEFQSSIIHFDKFNTNKRDQLKYLVVGDTETYVNEKEELIPYCICLYGYKNQIINESFYGDECQREFLYYCCKHQINTVFFHNLKFDGWLFKEFYIRDMIYHGGKLYSLTIFIKYKGEVKMIVLRDSLALINSALRNFPKMFNLTNIEKELFPYNKINEKSVSKNYLTLEECREEFNEEDFNKFIIKGKELNYLENDKINIKKLTIYYCSIDVKLLYEGLNKFNEYTASLFNGVIGTKFVTISGLSYHVMKENCFLNLPEYRGDIKKYIRESIRGGRCMTSNNEKIIVEDEVVDFDACSLYPSAMSRLYLPKGDIKSSDNENEIKDLFFNKLMYENQIEETNKRNVSAMILKVKVINLKKKRNFPLLNIKRNGINIYTNDVIGKEFYLTHIELEDFIKYQGGEVEFINCIYWTGNKDERMSEYIQYVYNLRNKYKTEGNPLQEVLKLFMNSSYGKTIQKDIDEEFKFLNKRDKKAFIVNNYERIKEIIKINSETYWIKCDGCSEPLVIPSQIGALILGMSKRIMNEVICTAEDNGIDVYYQDTDSIHIRKNDVESLSKAFEARFGRALEGSSMGQFHVDFPLLDNKKTWSKHSIFLGKKCYIDCLINEDGKEQSFIRMKGIPEEVIRTTCKEIGITEYDLYKELYEGKEIDFNLLKKKCPSFEFLKEFGIRCKQKFNRKVKF